MAHLVAEQSQDQIAARQDAPRSGFELVPRLIRDAGPKAVESYLCFFTKLDSRHTGYVMRAATKRFFQWAEETGLSLVTLRTGHVNDFFDSAKWKPSTTRFYFTCLRKLFAHLEADRIIERSPFIDAPTPKVGKNLGLADLKEFLKELDGYTEESDFYRPGLVAMYPVVIGGMDTKKIAKHTGLPLAEVELYANRLRKNGVWRDDGKISVTVDVDEEDGNAALTMEMVMIIGCAANVFELVPGDADGEEKLFLGDKAR